MSLPWFRFYHEFAGDPVLQGLDFGDQRHYIMVLCFKAGGLLDRDFPSPDFRNRMICRALGLDPIAAAEAKRRLCEVGLIDGDWQPPTWNNRQYKSDNSSARVKNWRQRKKEEKETKRDTDTESIVTSNVSVTLHETLPLHEWNEWLAYRKQRRWTCSNTTLNKQLKLLAKFDSKTQAEILDTSMQAGWQGLFPPKGTGQNRLTRYEQLTKQGSAVPAEPNAAAQFFLGNK